MILIVALLASLLPLIPALVFAIRRRKSPCAETARRLVLGLGGFNMMLALAVAGLGLVWFLAPQVVQAAGLIQTTSQDPYRSLAAAISVGIGSISAGYAVSTTGSAAVGAIAEKPDVFGRALIFVGLAEGTAIYGLIIAFLLIGR